jgi:hypothetical protein
MRSPVTPSSARRCAIGGEDDRITLGQLVSLAVLRQLEGALGDERVLPRAGRVRLDALDPVRSDLSSWSSTLALLVEREEPTRREGGRHPAPAELAIRGTA